MKTNYLDTPVGVYAKAQKGYYRKGAKALREVLTEHHEDEKILKYRKTGDKEIKRKILAYTPAGDYGKDSSRSAKNQLATATNLVQVDFDVKTPKATVKKLFDKYSWIAVASTSCGGNGFYLLVLTPDPKHYGEYFQALCDFFKEKEGLLVDKAVSSVNELRYLSLTSEAMMREDATVWKERVEEVVSQFATRAVPQDGEVMEFEEVGNLHYVDLVSYAGKNNSNGTPVEAAAAYPQPEMFSPDSHLRKMKQSKIAEIVTRIYEKYAEQYGEAVVPILSVSKEISLPPIKVKGKTSNKEYALKVVKNIFEAYLIKTDVKEKKSYRFNGVYWEAIDNHLLRNFLTECALASSISPLRAELTEFRDLMFEQLQDLTAANFETSSTAFNLANGVVTFQDGDVKFVQHSDEFMFTYVLDYNYEPGNKDSATYRKFIDRVMPSPDDQKMFWQYVASAFLPRSIKFEQMLFLIGSGSNGKSTLMSLLKDLFGDAVGTYSLDRLTESMGDTSAKEARLIYRKLLGVSFEDKEIDDFRLWRKLVSREPISVKYLYKDSFETDNYGRLISCMNEQPFVDSVDGSARRLVVIGMNERIRAEESDLQMNDKLKAERSAIFNLVVLAYKQLFAAKGVLVKSDEAIKLASSVVNDYDYVFQFVNDQGWLPPVLPIGALAMNNKLTRLEKVQRMNPGKELKGVTGQEIYELYKDWCEDTGHKRLGKTALLKRMRSLKGERFGCDIEARFDNPKDRTVGAEIWYIIKER